MLEHRHQHIHIARELASWLVSDEGDLQRVVRLVALFPEGAIDDLLRLADFLEFTDAGVRLEAAILYRHRSEVAGQHFERVMRAAGSATDRTRAEVFVTLAPWVRPEELDILIAEAAKIGDADDRRVALKELEELRDLRSIGLADPHAVPEPWSPPTPTPREPADARLIEVIEGLGAVELDQLLHDVHDQARANARGGMTAAAAPPPEEDAAEAPTVERHAAPPPPPIERSDVSPDASDAAGDYAAAPYPDEAYAPPERDTPRYTGPPPAAPPPKALPGLGGPLSAIGNALRNLGGTIRDAVSRPRETAAPSQSPDKVIVRSTGGGVAIGTNARIEILPPARKRPVVNTGLATRDEPVAALDPNLPLTAGRGHLFWLEIGEPVVDSIEATPTIIPPRLAEIEAELTVVLFDASRLRVAVEGAQRGRLRMRTDGSAVVLEQPTKDPPRRVKAELLNRRLYFPIETPAEDTSIHLRCNIYHDGVLVQSRLVRCLVRVQPKPLEGALRSTLDYLLARSLNPATLAAAGTHQLSIMTNENDGGTNGFYVAADGGKWARSAEFDDEEIQDHLTRARGGLRLAAWGNEEPWVKSRPYLYADAGSRAQLTDDLINLALRGYVVYDRIIERLAAGAGDAEDQGPAWLSKRMRPPGTIQIATHKTPRFVLPAAMIYDYKIDPGLSPNKFTLCDVFLDALDVAGAEDDPLKSADGLRKSTCFKGECPNAAGHLTVVCPSGLWGFRHAIGLPVSLESDEEWAKHGAKAWEPGEDEDPPTSIDAKSGLQMAVSISTDPALTLWPTHETGLRKTHDPLGWQFADTLEGTYDLFKAASAQVIYFYCHGGVENKLPYIQVGPVTDEGIFGASLRARDVVWKAPRPLVFINGCHTTNVEPALAHDLVTAFVTTARASGVIGTEITVFEPLAREFAELFFRAFFAGQPVGEAVRTARLAMLARSNPLGLAYTAYALASLKLTGLPN